jgi:peptidoglycan/LPS O-acetylase OafA/YrhL
VRGPQRRVGFGGGAPVPASTRPTLARMPALDGLRALAVAAVLLYHAGVPWAAGGFLGVDVFFALSGYLITSLLLLECGAAGRIDLPAFWARRVRRLLPALVVLLAGVAVYAALFAGATQLSSLRGDGIAALLYSSNWRLLFSHQSYFAQLGPISPLRHTWSLAIEEQWYLLWPLVVAAMLWITNGRRWLLATVTAAGAIASAITMAALYASNTDPSRAYYGTDARAQGLLLGGLLALFLPHLGRVGAGARRALRGIGGASLLILLMLVGLANEADGWLYRGGFALAALATTAVVTAVSDNAGILHRLLTLRPLRYIGRISYGLYLWHWPLNLALSPTKTHIDGAPLVLLRLGAALLVAVASYHVIEQPVLQGRIRIPRLRFTLPVIGGAVTTALVLATIGGIAPGPIVPSAAAFPAVAAAPSTVPITSATSTQQIDTAATAPTAPSAPTAEHPRRVLFVGDSVSMTLAAALYASPAPVPTQVISAAIVGCGVVRNDRYTLGSLNRPTPECAHWPQRWKAAVDKTQPNVVVLVFGAWEVFDPQINGHRAAFGGPEHEAMLREALDEAFRTLAGHRVLALTVPCYQNFDDGIFRHGGERNDPARVAWINTILRDEAAKKPGVDVPDLHSWLCPNEQYQRDMFGVRLRSDDGVHIDRAAGPALWKWLEPYLDR